MSTSQKFKLAGLVVGLAPIGFFLLFAVGEGVGGWSHYVQLAIPLITLALAWWFPRLGGGLLLLLGLAFGVWYPIGAHTMPIATILLVELIVTAPAVVSGYLFLRCS